MGAKESKGDFVECPNPNPDPFGLKESKLYCNFDLNKETKSMIDELNKFKI